ncbi:hypothetical protein D3C87_2141390 [compost metagenome]
MMIFSICFSICSMGLGASLPENCFLSLDCTCSKAAGLMVETESIRMKRAIRLVMVSA